MTALDRFLREEAKLVYGGLGEEPRRPSSNKSVKPRRCIGSTVYRDHPWWPRWVRCGSHRVSPLGSDGLGGLGSGRRHLGMGLWSGYVSGSAFDANSNGGRDSMRRADRLIFAAAVFAGAAAVALASPAMSSGESANALMLQIANHIESANRSTSDASRVDEVRAAKSKIYRLRAEFPDNPAALTLATGQAIGSVSLPQIEEILKGPFDCNTDSDPLSIDCAFTKAQQAIRKVDALGRSSIVGHSLKAKADLAIGLATVRDFDRALEVLGTLAPTGEDAPPHWRYVKASSVIACELARAGYGTESERLLARLVDMKDVYRQGYVKERVATAFACSGRVDRAIAVAKEIPGDHTRASEGYCDGDRVGQGEEHFIWTVAAIANALIENGDPGSALVVLDDHTQVLLTVDRRTACAWWSIRSHVVETYARIGRVLAEHSPAMATRAYDRGLGAAAGSSPETVWADIGDAAIENRSIPSLVVAGPIERAEHSTADLLTLALSMHRSGVDSLQARSLELLEAAQRAGGTEPGPATQIAAARAEIQGEEAGRIAFDRAVALTWESDRMFASAYCNVYRDGWDSSCSAPVRPACRQSYDVAAEALYYLAIGEAAQARAVVICQVQSMGTSSPETIEYEFNGIETVLIDIAKQQIEAGQKAKPTLAATADFVPPSIHDWNQELLARALIQIVDREIEFGLTASSMLTAEDIAAVIVDRSLLATVLIDIAERQIEAGLNWHAKAMVVAAAEIADEMVVSATDAANPYLLDENGRWTGPGLHARIAQVLSRRY